MGSTELSGRLAAEGIRLVTLPPGFDLPAPAWLPEHRVIALPHGVDDADVEPMVLEFLDLAG